MPKMQSIHFTHTVKSIIFLWLSNGDIGFHIKNTCGALVELEVPLI